MLHQRNLELIGSAWPPQEIALTFIAPEQTQKRQLIRTFDPFGDHLFSQVVGQSDNRHYERCIIWMARRVFHERCIKLN